MSAYVIYYGGHVPEVILYRYCPKDPFHWRCDGETCPACGTTIEVKRYVPQ